VQVILPICPTSPYRDLAACAANPTGYGSASCDADTILPLQHDLKTAVFEPPPTFGLLAQMYSGLLYISLVFFAEPTITHDSSSDPGGRVISVEKSDFQCTHFPGETRRSDWIAMRLNDSA